MLSACSTTADSDYTPLAVCAPETELTITSSKEQVSEFISKNKNLISLYDGEVYRMGEGFAMGDVISMALADINMDNQYELYYTFVSGSGMPYSITGYFDPVSKENTIFDYVSYMNLMLTMNESGDLCVNDAVRERDWDSYVDSTIKA